LAAHALAIRPAKRNSRRKKKNINDKDVNSNSKRIIIMINKEKNRLL
jgi:hypothetical protein